MKLKKKVSVARRIRRMHSPEFKARIALEALRNTKTVSQLCQEHDLHATQINDWKDQLIAGAKGVFGAPVAKPIDTTAMEAKIGRLTLENDFFATSAHQSGIAERKEMIDRTNPLPITAQAKVLGISRGSVYYLPAPIPEADIALMKEMAKLHFEHPFMGQRQLLGQLHRLGYEVGRCHVRSLMRRMGIRAMCPQPGSATSCPAPGHRIYEYLLCGLEINEANQVWALDTTLHPHGTRLCLPGCRH